MRVRIFVVLGLGSITLDSRLSLIQSDFKIKDNRESRMRGQPELTSNHWSLYTWIAHPLLRVVKILKPGGHISTPTPAYPSSLRLGSNAFSCGIVMGVLDLDFHSAFQWWKMFWNVMNFSHHAFCSQQLWILSVSTTTLLWSFNINICFRNVFKKVRLVNLVYF